jgi:hypothetical protein
VLPGNETANAGGKDKRASRIAEGRLRVRLAKSSAPSPLLTATGSIRTWLEDGSGDRCIKSARPYQYSHGHRLSRRSAKRMNQEGKLPRVDGIHRFAELFGRVRNDFAFGRNPLGASRFASRPPGAHDSNARRFVGDDRGFVLLPGCRRFLLVPG